MGVNWRERGGGQPLTSSARRLPPSAMPSLVFFVLRLAKWTKAPLSSSFSFRYVRSSGVPPRPWTTASDTLKDVKSVGSSVHVS